MTTNSRKQALTQRLLLLKTTLATQDNEAINELVDLLNDGGQEEVLYPIVQAFAEVSFVRLGQILYQLKVLSASTAMLGGLDAEEVLGLLS